jgi:hypothetical protein
VSDQQGSLMDLHMHVVAIPQPQRCCNTASGCRRCCGHILEGREGCRLEGRMDSRGKGHEPCHASSSSCQPWLDWREP